MATKLKRVTTDWNETLTYEIRVEQNNAENGDFGDEDIIIDSPSLELGVPLNEFLAVYSAMSQFISVNKLKVC